MLQGPVEPRQYTSVAFTQRLIDEGVDPSVGSVGDALDCENDGGCLVATIILTIETIPNGPD